VIRFANDLRANVDALRAFRRTKPWPRRIADRWFEIAVVAAGVVFWSLTSVFWFVLALVAWFRVEIRFWRALRRQPADEYEVEFDDDGVVFRTAGHESKTLWSTLSGVVDSERVVLLLPSQGSNYGFVPRHAFPDERTLAVFVRTAAAGIAKGQS
jgi:hypothetical protein